MIMRGREGERAGASGRESEPEREAAGGPRRIAADPLTACHVLAGGLRRAVLQHVSRHRALVSLEGQQNGRRVREKDPRCRHRTVLRRSVLRRLSRFVRTDRCLRVCAGCRRRRQVADVDLRVVLAHSGLPGHHGIRWVERAAPAACLREDGALPADPNGLVPAFSLWFHCLLTVVSLHSFDLSLPLRAARPLSLCPTLASLHAHVLCVGAVCVVRVCRVSDGVGWQERKSLGCIATKVHASL